MQVSVIIPTANRAAILRGALGSLADLEFNRRDYEILVIDNASVDGTRVVVEQAAADRPAPDIRYVHEPVPGLLAGRHRGALESKGDICAFLDDDVRVSRDWLDAVAEAFRRPETVLVGGPSSPVFETAPPEWLADFYEEDEQGRHCGWLSLFDGGCRVKDVDPCNVWGLNYSIRRHALFDLGGFHPDLVPKPLQRYQGDGETGLSLKVKEAGLAATYHPDAAVTHTVPASRLTTVYFEERAFYQGVCDSYSQIRAEGAATPEVHLWRSAYRRFRRLLGGDRQPERSPEESVLQRTAKAHAAGHAFHQSEVRRDPALLEWITRRDYWDYRLPAGWQRYMARPDTESRHRGSQ